MRTNQPFEKEGELKMSFKPSSIKYDLSLQNTCGVVTSTQNQSEQGTRKNTAISFLPGPRGSVPEHSGPDAPLSK